MVQNEATSPTMVGLGMMLSLCAGIMVGVMATSPGEKRPVPTAATIQAVDAVTTAPAPTTESTTEQNLRNLLAVHEAEAKRRNDQFANDVELMTEKEVEDRIAYWNIEANPSPGLHQSVVPLDGKIREAVEKRAYWRSVLKAKQKE